MQNGQLRFLLFMSGEQWLSVDSVGVEGIEKESDHTRAASLRDAYGIVLGLDLFG
jgi:hypothetical protein